MEMNKKFDLMYKQAKLEMVKLTSEILIDLLKFRRNIDHLGAEWNAFPAINAAVRP